MDYDYPPSPSLPLRSMGGGRGCRTSILTVQFQTYL